MRYSVLSMLFRFCLYGFLKNQKYFDPFLILAFREKGLSFTAIGLLIGFRELCINLLEIPTGAIADVAGRRQSMIFSFTAYIVAFLGFGLLSSIWSLFAAMFFFSIGEAFRTGTHKAMIFDWLTRQNRAHEKTKVYGLTRSWSKLGSAASTIVAMSLVWMWGILLKPMISGALAPTWPYFALFLVSSMFLRFTDHRATHAAIAIFQCLLMMAFIGLFGMELGNAPVSAFCFNSRICCNALSAASGSKGIRIWATLRRS